MSLTRLEDEGLPKNPNLQIAEWKFLLQKPDLIDKEVIRFQLMNAITMGNMAPFYEECCNTFQWKVDQELLNSMKSANEKTLKELEEQLIDAETNLGEMEVRDTLLKKSEYLCSIGAKEAALDSFRETYDKTISLGQRLDIIFHLIRIGFFYFDHDLIAKNIEKAQSLIEKGGDWDRRNRLKVYQGVFCMMTRNFKCSPNFFLDTSLTFTSYEIMDYSQFVRYIILISMIALSRSELRKKIIKSSEIAEVLYSSPEVKQFLYSLFNCQYAQFFKNLGNMESVLKSDYFLSQHVQYYIREMKIIAYSQLLESYRSLSLQYMAKVFGVTEEYMDQDLSRFIAAGRLNCKIDKVSETVETNHPDSKYWQYLEIIKQGDILLNRVQKLSRVIDI